MKKKIIKLSILAVTLCAVLFTTFVPALADSSLDGSTNSLKRYISENGGLVQSGLNGWERTGSAFRFVGEDISSADLVEIGLPHDYKSGYMTALSISGSISASSVDAPSFSVSFYDKNVLYVDNHRVYAMSLEGEFAEICSFTLNINFKIYVGVVDGNTAFAYYIQPDDSDMIYGLALPDLLSDAEGTACVYIHPSVDRRGYIGVTQLVVSEMDALDSHFAFNGIYNSAILSNMDFILSESYNNGYTDGYDVGYGDGFDDGEAQGGGGNTDGSYDEGYAAGKTDGFNEGYAQGKTEGQVIGQDVGYTAGLAAGKELGYADGKADGLAEVEQKEETAYNNGFTAGKTEGKAEGYTEGKADGLANLEKEKTDAYNNGYDVGFGWGEDYGHEQGYEEGWDAGREDGLITGAEVGYDSGFEDGKEVGYANGFAAGSYDNGYSDGYSDGYDVGHFDGETDGYSSAYNDGYVDGKYDGDLEGYNRGHEEGYNSGYYTGMDEAAEIYYNQIYQDALDKIDQNQGTGVQGFLAGMWAGTQGFMQELLDGITFSGLSLRSIVTTVLALALAAFVIRLLKG